MSQIGLTFECDKWHAITNANKLFFISGTGAWLSAASSSYNYTGVNNGIGYGHLTYNLNMDLHIGLSYIRNAHWIWQLKYSPFDVFVNYTRTNKNWASSSNDSVTASTYIFQSGFGLSLIYLFGKEKTETR